MRRASVAIRAFDTTDPDVLARAELVRDLVLEQDPEFTA